MSSVDEVESTDPKMRIDKKMSNLTRIRDNQRRSRARHKEYVQDLEQKYRACQQAGSEASAEVQAAARAVLEENQRLRALLEQQGIPQQLSGKGSPPALLQDLLTSKRLCCDDREQKARAIVISPPQRMNPPPTTASKPANRGPGPAANFSPNAPYGMPWILPSSPEVHPAGDLTVHERQTGATRPIKTSPSNMTCSEAAGLIRGPFPHTGPELEQDMNCASNPARCVVSNTRVFELMEKYGWG